MCIRRTDTSIGVLDGVIYAVGGYDGREVCRSVETYIPSAGVWTFIADMHVCRKNAGIFIFI